MIYISKRDFELHDTAVTIGKFDGLHTGHMQLIRHLLEYKVKGLKAAVMRLDFVPAESETLSLRPVEKEIVLRTEEERKEILEGSGVDIYVRYPFEPADFSMSAEDFAERVIAGKLGAKAVVVGDDFRFGFERRGDARMLADLGRKLGFTVEVVKRACIDGVPVSSSLIREYLQKGDTEKALKMLDK